MTSRLMLVGRAGCGKSSTGNTILGRSVFPVRRAFQLDKDMWAESAPEEDGLEVKLVDTLGFFDTEVRQEDIVFDLARAVCSMHPGPHVVLFVIRTGRFTTEEITAFEQLKAVFGNDVSKHVIVVFTGGDLIKQSHTDIEELLDHAPLDLRGLLEECENRYAVIDNTITEEEQVRCLLRQVNNLKRKNRDRPFKMANILDTENEIDKDLLNKKLKEFELSQLQKEENQLQHCSEWRDATHETNEESEREITFEEKIGRVLHEYITRLRFLASRIFLFLYDTQMT